MALRTSYRPISARHDRPVWVVFCRSRPRSLMVKSVGNDWSGRMQMGGQVSAIIHCTLSQTQSRYGPFSSQTIHQD